MKYLNKRILWLFLVFFIILTLVIGMNWLWNNDPSIKDNNSNTPPAPTGSDEQDVDSNTFVVRFVTDNGMVIAVNECDKGAALIPPTSPQRIGYVFTGWDGNFSNITQSTDITARYTDISRTVNVIAADTVYTYDADEFEVLIGIYGEVSFCGLDMEITYDSSLLEYIEATEIDDCVILNDETSGIIHTNYVSTNNTTGEVAFMTLRFKAKTTNNAETGLQIKVNSMYLLDEGEALAKAEYQALQNRIIIGGTE